MGVLTVVPLQLGVFWYEIFRSGARELLSTGFSGMNCFSFAFDGFFEVLLLEAEADQMLHSPGTSFVLNYLGTINEGSRSLFFS